MVDELNLQGETAVLSLYHYRFLNECLIQERGVFDHDLCSGDFNDFVAAEHTLKSLVGG